MQRPLRGMISPACQPQCCTIGTTFQRHSRNKIGLAVKSRTSSLRLSFLPKVGQTRNVSNGCIFPSWQCLHGKPRSAIRTGSKCILVAPIYEHPGSLACMIHARARSGAWSTTNLFWGCPEQLKIRKMGKRHFFYGNVCHHHHVAAVGCAGMD